MKKSVTVVLVIVMAVVLSSFTIFSAREDTDYITRAGAVEEIIKALYLTDADTEFTFEDHYCLHPDGGGNVHFVPDAKLLHNGYPILCELYASANEVKFKDVSQQNGNSSTFIVLAEAMNIIRGFEDSTFRPDSRITYNEAVTMLVRAFISGEMPDSYTYPEDYINTAIRIGIIPDNSISGNDIISRGEFLEILAAAIKYGYSKNLMELFVPPSTADECVLAYANASMNRNGAAQFALYDDGLKDATRNDFVNCHWFIGMSSPWISGFDIVNIEGLKYELTFHWATSTGPSGDTTIKLLLREINDSYRIAEITTLGSVVIPIVGKKYSVEDSFGNQASSSAPVTFSDKNILSLTELSTTLDICWYLDNDVQKCAYRRFGGDWIRFVSEDSGYRDGFGAGLFNDLFGHSGFYITAPRGAAYYAKDYYYFDVDGTLRFLFDGTYLDTFVDFNNDGDNELLWFYHGGRDAEYYYLSGGELFSFDIIGAILERFTDWDYGIELDPLSFSDNTIELKNWSDDSQHTAQVSFSEGMMIVRTEES